MAEIGSTVTSVSAFQGLDGPRPEFLGQGFAPTTVEEGDVYRGLEGALEDLQRKRGQELRWECFLAASSAAGGLRMSVHGLVRDMTVRAAREAALGAGANLSLITGGKMGQEDREKLQALAPNIVLLAGGVDYGEKETVLHNARLLAETPLTCPVIYAGNVQAQGEIQRIFQNSGVPLSIIPNIYPRIDCLEVEGARRFIQEVFEQHITQAPGMERIRDMGEGPLLPTPGAVLEAAKLLREEQGDLAVIDVGGATTDVHAVCEDSQEFGSLLLAPEPQARRTVEGDLGTYVSRRGALEAGGLEALARKLNLSEEALSQGVEALPPLPQTEGERRLAGALAETAAGTALSRHAGRVKDLYGPQGKVRVAEGKDLTGLHRLIATGGALTRLPHREARLRRVLGVQPPDALAPPRGLPLAFDDHYIMAAAGVLSRLWPQGALTLLGRSLGLSPGGDSP